MRFYLLRLSLQWDGTDCLPPQHAAPSRMVTDELSRVSVNYKPRELDFGSVFFRRLTSAFFTQNQVDTLNLPFQCRVNVAPHREVAVRISGVMRIENLHAVSIKPPTSEFGCSRSRGLQGAVCQTFVFLSTLQLQFRIFQLVASASVELPSSSPMFLPDERPVRHVS